MCWELSSCQHFEVPILFWASLKHGFCSAPLFIWAPLLVQHLPNLEQQPWVWLLSSPLSFSLSEMGLLEVLVFYTQLHSFWPQNHVSFIRTAVVE